MTAFIYEEEFYCKFCQIDSPPLKFNLQQVNHFSVLLHFSLKQNTLSSHSVPFPPPCIHNQLPAHSYWPHRCESIHVQSARFMLLCLDSRCSFLKNTSPTQPNVRARKSEQSQDLPPLPYPGCHAVKNSVNTPEGIRCLIFKCSAPQEINGNSSSFQQNYRIWVQLGYHSLASEREPEEPWQSMWVTTFISSYIACGWKKMRCVWWSLWVVL